MGEITKIKVNGEPESSYQLYPRNEEFAKRSGGEIVSSSSVLVTLSASGWDAGHQGRWDRVWADKLCGKYRHPDHEDHFLWGNAFFEAPIADLNYIAALVGAGKEP